MLHCVNHILLLLWAKTWVNRQRIVSQSFIYIIFIMIQKNYSCFNLSLCYSQACGNWVTFGKQIYKTNRSDFLNELVQAESKFIFLMMSSLIFLLYLFLDFIHPPHSHPIGLNTDSHSFSYLFHWTKCQYY